jgi:hypothetical protein
LRERFDRRIADLTEGFSLVAQAFTGDAKGVHRLAPRLGPGGIEYAMPLGERLSRARANRLDTLRRLFDRLDARLGALDEGD